MIITEVRILILFKTITN